MLDSTTGKSAFTPVSKQPVAQFNLFEPSPMIKNMLFSAVRLQPALLMQQSSNMPLKRLFSPANITPSQFLRKDFAEPMLNHEPTSFSFEVIMPQRMTSMLAESPFASKESD